MARVKNDESDGSGPDDEDEWRPPARITTLYRTVPPNMFSATNRPTAGARDDQPLPVGNADLQLYSLATPNGQKVRSITLEKKCTSFVQGRCADCSHVLTIVTAATFIVRHLLPSLSFSLSLFFNFILHSFIVFPSCFIINFFGVAFCSRVFYFHPDRLASFWRSWGLNTTRTPVILAREFSSAEASWR